jgi:branched-chain amino acid transport system ATP-binding protein
VPEERRIFPELSVLDTLMLGVNGGKIRNTHDPHTWTIERIFHHFPKLKERIHQAGGQLSGGEQQMLSIGRSLMGNPRLLLVDEPTEGLDPIMVEEVRNVLDDINKNAGVSILLVEHNLQVALSLAQRIYLMQKASIDCEITSSELDSSEEIRAKFLEV